MDRVSSLWFSWLAPLKAESLPSEQAGAWVIKAAHFQPSAAELELSTCACTSAHPAHVVCIGAFETRSWKAARLCRVIQMPLPAVSWRKMPLVFLFSPPRSRNWSGKEEVVCGSVALTRTVLPWDLADFLASEFIHFFFLMFLGQFAGALGGCGFVFYTVPTCCGCFPRDRLRGAFKSHHSGSHTSGCPAWKHCLCFSQVILEAVNTLPWVNAQPEARQKKWWAMTLV